jgi:hypothetical protein
LAGKRERSEVEGAVVFVADTTSMAPLPERDFRIAYSWNPTAEEPTNNAVHALVKKADQ